MPATSRMWRSTRWMLAVWWRPLRAGAPAREQRLGRPMLFQTTFPRGRLRRVRTSYSRPIRRWPCLIRSGRGGVEAAGAEVRAEAGREAVVKAAPVEAVAEEKVAPVEALVEAEEVALAA